MDYQALLQYFEDRQPEMLQVIELVVSQETPSSDKVRRTRESCTGDL